MSRFSSASSTFDPQLGVHCARIAAFPYMTALGSRTAGRRSTFSSCSGNIPCCHSSSCRPEGCCISCHPPSQPKPQRLKSPLCFISLQSHMLLDLKTKFRINPTYMANKTDNATNMNPGQIFDVTDFLGSPGKKTAEDRGRVTRVCWARLYIVRLLPLPFVLLTPCSPPFSTAPLRGYDPLLLF